MRRCRPGRREFAALALAAVVATALFGIDATAATYRARPGAKTTKSDSLIRYVKTLADPKWEGRGVGTAGIDSAARWIANQFAAYGLEPAGTDGSWFQPFEVTTGVKVGEPCGIAVAGATFATGDAFQPLGFSTNGTLRAPVVFVGYGITAPGYDYDDYAGIDAHDKLVVAMTNEPGELDSTSKFDGNVNTPHAEARTKAIVAREHGALGLILVNGPRHHAGEPVRAPRTDGAGYMSSGLLAANVSDDVAAQIFKISPQGLLAAQEEIDRTGKPRSFALPESVTLTVTLERTRAEIKNVVGMLPGRDSSRTLVVGAHYDHLGMGNENSLAPDQHVAHVGADDNASGTAAMMGVARRIAARPKPPEHTMVFVAFTGEESGLLGSGHFVGDPPRPLETVETMLNMDMVGRLRDNKLSVMGVGTASEFPALVKNANAALASGKFDIHTSEDGYGPSDHSSFYKKNVPVLFLFTGAHADYHKPSDTWDKINAKGLERVSAFATNLIDSLDARPRVTYQRAKADSSMGRIAGGAGYGAYLGTIPDYMQTEGGVLLSGVRDGGPAATAGITGGDTIVKFDGVKVDNIYDYTYALRSRKPGQQVRITIKRGGEEKDLMVTLGRRP
jgi:hypothetical protein